MTLRGRFSDERDRPRESLGGVGAECGGLGWCDGIGGWGWVI
jgi:hypothetical protein